MRFQQRHRVLEPLISGYEKGQIIYFLTGPGIKDNYLYDVYYGTLSLDDTLKTYYLLDAEAPFDYFLHITSATNIKCYQNNNGKVENVEYETILDKPQTSGALKVGKSSGDNNTIDKDKKEKVMQEVQSKGGNARLDQLYDKMRHSSKKFFLFVDRMEWVAELYKAEPGADSANLLKLIPQLTKLRNLMMVVTISDFELLAKYHYETKETFIGYPSAEEIKYAYFRHLLRNTSNDYNLNMKVLDDVAHSMSVGKKSLVACMRILRTVLKYNHKELLEEDFAASTEINIEEKVLWENVRLPKEKKAEIQGAIDKFLAEDASVSRKGILLTGPPGTGKTMIAKALANEARCYFMAPKLSDMKGEYVGHSSANVRRIFAEARANAPTILFIDEADTVFPSRNAPTGEKDSFSLDIVNQSLQEIDGADTGEQKIFVIAATNRPEVIDSAIRSRLSRTPIEIPLPAKEERQLIFDDFLSKQNKGFSIRGKKYEELILTRSEGMSGRDIENFAKKILEENIPLYDDQTSYKIFEKAFLGMEKALLNDMTGVDGVFDKDSICAPEDNKSSMKEDIIGYEDLKERIRQQGGFIKANDEEKEEYKKYGIAVEKGILMYGPPGNGKSELAKAAAGELGFYFFKVISREFASSSSEIQIKRLEKIFYDTSRFSKLMTNIPGIVLFFDEIDALADTRVLNPEVRGSLLNFLSDESLRGRDSKILFIAATNNEHLLDEAVKRKGRIDVHYFMDNPTEDDGKTMLKAFFEKDKKVELKSDASDIYLRTIKELRDKFIIDKFGTTEWEKRVQDDDKQMEIKRIIAEQRPSGAELNTIYHELKSIAFHHKKIEANKLVIDNDVVDIRFPEYNY